MLYKYELLSILNNCSLTTKYLKNYPETKTQFKVNITNTTKISSICSKLTIKKQIPLQSTPLQYLNCSF